MGSEVLIPMAVSLFGAVAQRALAPKEKAAPSVEAQKPIPAPQAPQAADSAIFSKNNAASASAQGPASTLLTGLGGVPNESLNLGRNTFLGA